MFSPQVLYVIIALVVLETLFTIYLRRTYDNEMIGTAFYVASLSCAVFILRYMKKNKLLIQKVHNEYDLNSEAIIKVLTKSRARILSIYDLFKSTFVRMNVINLSIISTTILGFLIVFRNIQLYIIFNTIIASVTAFLVFVSFRYRYLISREQTH